MEFFAVYATLGGGVALAVAGLQIISNLKKALGRHGAIDMQVLMKWAGMEEKNTILHPLQRLVTLLTRKILNTEKINRKQKGNKKNTENKKNTGNTENKNDKGNTKNKTNNTRQEAQEEQGEHGEQEEQE